MPNYVFKPTAEQALRSIQSAARRRLNTALGLSPVSAGGSKFRNCVIEGARSSVSIGR